MKVWVNGQFVDDEDATVSVFDAGFQHGVGLFETMTIKNSQIFRAREHLERLGSSAAALRLTENLHIEPLLEALTLTLNENKQESARMRLTLTGGDLNLLQQTGKSEHMDPTIVIQSQPTTQYPEEFFENGVFVSLASGRINPYDFSAGHKTVNYWSKLLNLQMAAMQQCGEALWLTPSAHVTGGCVSNLFIVKNGTLFTPTAQGEENEQDEPSAVIPGITRAAVIEIANGIDVGTSRQTLTLDDVLDADEMFLTNSSWGVLPVVGIRTHVKANGDTESKDQSIGDGVVGQMTVQMLTSYQSLLDEETTAVIV